MTHAFASSARRLFVVVVSALLLPSSGFAAVRSDIADAAQRKDLAAVRAQIEKKADVNAPQPDGTTALHWAARWNDLDMARALVQAGAVAKAANRDGATPMFLASES